MFTWYSYILWQFFEGFELGSGPFWVNSLFSHHFSDQQVTWVLISPLTLIWFHKLAEWILCKQEHNWDKKNKLLLSGLCSSSRFFFLGLLSHVWIIFFHQELCVIYLLLLYTLLTILSVQLFWSLCFIPICFIQKSSGTFSICFFVSETVHNFFWYFWPMVSRCYMIFSLLHVKAYELWFSGLSFCCV
jgi:hypothetical protein